jgi:decaprenylphospho-beta-D-erythro-pentofuranosid-2-ulose 2-reductase
VLAAAGDVDAVFVAFGALGEPYSIDDTTTAEAVDLAQLNFGAGVGATHAAARHLQAQGHGSLVVFSSVAGLRVRPENAVYGAGKAGLDGFANALADELHGSGVHVMIVRPGYVHTKMTEGREAAPFATTPEAVAADVVDGLRKRRRVVWSPAKLRAVFGGLKVLPGPVWRRVIE